MKIREHAKGKWGKIIAELIGPEYADHKHHPCPHGEGRDRFRLSEKGECGVYFCACSEGDKDGFELLQCVKGWTFKEAADAVESVIGKCPDDGERRDRKETWAERLRRETVKTEWSRYLSRRGLEVAPGLEWHKALPYYEDQRMAGKYPAMLAPITDARGEFLTYHATYLAGGAKAPVDPARKILPANGRLEGGACRLYPPDTHLGIAEGVETAIAAKVMFGVPTWAALNTALLAKWQPPEGVEKVTVYADNDPHYGGHSAAYQLAHRLAKRGYEVNVQMPLKANDWNDVLREEQAEVTA